MKRYGATPIISKKSTRKKSKHTHLKPTIYNKIPLGSNDIWVISQWGDRLDTIAHQFYGDETLWWYVAKANNLKFNNIKTGTLLRIPGTTTNAKGR